MKEVIAFMEIRYSKGLTAWVLVVSSMLFCIQAAFAQTALSTPALKKAPVELLVCAAASLSDVMAEQAEAYKLAAPHVTLTMTFGSSGALQTQIEEGAPADLFFSAGKKQMKALLEKELLIPESDVDLLENKVVLIVPNGSTLALASFEDTGLDKVKLIALGEPSGVPVGQYAKQIFESLNLWEVISQKANFGSDVRQVLTWVEGGDVDCGVVYATDAMISNLVSVVAIAPEGSSDKIIYPAAVIKTSLQQEEALAFLAFLQTMEAEAIFEKNGFSPINK